MWSERRLFLRLADSQTITRVAAELHRGRRIAHKWGERFEKKRLAGLIDEPRSGRPARFSPRSTDLLTPQRISRALRMPSRF
jgi:transposase